MVGEKSGRSERGKRISGRILGPDSWSFGKIKKKRKWRKWIGLIVLCKKGSEERMSTEHK